MDYRQIEPAEYTKITQSYPKKHFPIEQSPAWGTFQSQIPGRDYIGTFLLTKHGRPMATASLLRLTMRGYSYIWVNQGPVWLSAAPGAATTNEVAQTLRHIATAQAVKKTKPLFIRAHFPRRPAKSAEAYSKSLIEKTTIVDLRQDFDVVLARMNYGARRGMRKAEKSGFTVREVPAAEAAADFAPYYDILRETATRDGYYIHPANTYQKMLTSLGDHVRFFVGFNPQGAPVTWALTTVYQNYGVYYYGASNEAARKVMAPYLLHVQIMRTLQTEGVQTYDFLGIGSKKFPGLEGVTQFKLRFGGDVIDYLPVYDLPLSPAYHPWKWAQALKHKLRK